MFCCPLNVAGSLNEGQLQGNDITHVTDTHTHTHSRAHSISMLVMKASFEGKKKKKKKKKREKGKRILVHLITLHTKGHHAPKMYSESEELVG